MMVSMIKRIICWLLLCALLLGAYPALAEAPVRTMLNINGYEFAWFKEHGVAYRDFENYRDHNTQQVLDMLQGEDAMDIVLIDTHYCDLDRLMRSGLLEDLSTNEVIQARTQAIYEPLRNRITTEKGEILAAFRDLQQWPTTRIPAAWKAAGLTDAEAPQSFTDFLNFVEQRWIPLVREKKVGNIRLNTNISRYALEYKERYTAWFIHLLMECWELKRQAAGETMIYSDPQFVALAERCREVGRALAKAEKKPGKKSLSLYQCEYGFDEAKAYTNALPMRLTVNEPVQLAARAELYVVRKDSPHAQTLKAFLAALLTMEPEGAYRMDPAIYADVPFDETLLPSAMYQHSESWQQAYRSDWLFLWKMPGGDGIAYARAQEGLCSKFAKEKISAEQLAKHLDEKLKLDER